MRAELCWGLLRSGVPAPVAVCSIAGKSIAGDRLLATLTHDPGSRDASALNSKVHKLLSSDPAPSKAIVRCAGGSPPEEECAEVGNICWAVS